MKNYISPTTLVVAIKTQQMIASTTLNASDGTPSVEVSSNTYGGTFSSRRSGDSWADDEE